VGVSFRLIGMRHPHRRRCRPYTSQALARRIRGPDPLRPAAIRAHAELVADVLLNGIVAS